MILFRYVMLKGVGGYLCSTGRYLWPHDRYTYCLGIGTYYLAIGAYCLGISTYHLAIGTYRLGIGTYRLGIGTYRLAIVDRYLWAQCVCCLLFFIHEGEVPHKYINGHMFKPDSFSVDTNDPKRRKQADGKASVAVQVAAMVGVYIKEGWHTFFFDGSSPKYLRVGYIGGRSRPGQRSSRHP